MKEELTTINNPVSVDNKLKEIIVDHVGSVLNPENDEVTLEMVINAMAEEFPEFLLCVAEENWVRGYQQALIDVDYGKKLENERLHSKQAQEQ